ncbi:unnamed protein product, partial [Phaeothamnion confervicola]
MWIQTLNSQKSASYVERFDRLMKYRAQSPENEAKLDKAMRALEKAALSLPVSESLLSIFMGLPDTADDQPFTGLSYGRRTCDPTAQRDEYLKLASHADALLKFLGKPGAELHIPKTHDAKTIKSSATEADRLYQAGMGGRRGLIELKWLAAALRGANPHRWYLTKQPLAEDRARKTYVKLVAGLNRYLSKGQHVALATLANANLPGQKVTPDEIRKAW